MDDKRSLKLIAGVVIVVAVFGAGFLFGKHSAPKVIPQPGSINFSLFWDAYNKLHENFIDPSKINDQKIIYGAIEGMTKSLGDPYTDFFDPAQAKAFNQDLSGSFEGIGVEMGLKKGQLTVIAPLAGSPGEKAGLRSGDLVVKINGKDTTDMSIDDAVTLIRGKKGTQITLTVFREGWSNVQDFSITRDTIKVDSVKWQLKEGNIAYINILQFDQSLSADFRKTVYEIMASPAKRIVIDLRNNPGGYLEVAQDVAGWLLKTGSVVTVEAGKDERQTYKAEGNGAFADYPIVVLINKGSASASEILAGALRDDRGIQLIGEKSFGKGSVQEVINLTDGSSFLKITVAKWLTPKGNSISEVGLTPDIKVDLTDDDIKAGKDPQLDKAIEIVKGLK